jgi:anti-sigma factor RsiW
MAKMPCDVQQEKRASFFDGELPGAEQATLARHIAGCTSCTQALRQLQALRARLKMVAPVLPDGLAARVALALADAGEVQLAPAALDSRWRLPQFAGLAASYAAVALMAGGLGYSLMARQQATDTISHDVVAAHVRALMQEAPYQVASSDQHTVKPWFAGRAEFAPQVRDFGAQGFALAGGRLDYVAGQRVAALVYRHDKHVVDLLMWPTAKPDARPQYSMSEGFHLASWISGGLEARAISDMGADEMKAFAGLASEP